MSTTETPAPKKRKRIPQNCSHCRQKRIKCDRNRPICGSCLRSNSADKCHYEQQFEDWTTMPHGSFNNATITSLWKLKDESFPKPPVIDRMSSSELEESDKSMRSELDSLKSELDQLKRLLKSQKGANRFDSIVGYRSPQHYENSADSSPPSNPNEYIDFYANYTATLIRSSRVMFHGPLSHHAVLARDSFAHLGWSSLRETNPKEIKKIKAFKADINKKEIVPLSVSVADLKETMKQKIQNVLPERRTLWLFIDRFFKYVYPLYPYIDKEDFIENIKSIIGPQMDSAYPIQIDLQQRSDFSYMGLLLIIIRMAHLSIVYNKMDPTKDSGVYSHLRTVPASTKLIALAQLCLNQYRILRKASLPVFQLALYLRIYDRDSPEYDGNNDTVDVQIFTGLLFQIAYAIGLHMEPPNTCNDRDKYVRRKAWFFLQQLDLEECLSTSVPLRLRGSESNIKLPEFFQEEIGESDILMENKIIRYIHQSYELSAALTDIAACATSFTPSKISDLETKMAAIKSLTVDEFGSLNNIIASKFISDDFTKVRAIKNHLTGISILIRLRYHLMLHYEANGLNASARSQLLKILELMQDLVANYDLRNFLSSHLSCGNETLFYSLQYVSVLVYVFYFGLCIRCDRISNMILDVSTSRTSKLASIKFQMLQSMITLVFSESRYSSSHYTCWRAVRNLFNKVKGLEKPVFTAYGTLQPYLTNSKSLPMPGNNLLSDCPDSFLDEVERLTDRSKCFPAWASSLAEYNLGISQEPEYYLELIKDSAWTKHKTGDVDRQFYANLSNHNVNSGSLDDIMDDVFADLVDF